MHALQKIKTKILLSLFLISSTGCVDSATITEKCDMQDLQRCASCKALSNVIDLKKPDMGEYYRGAFWNGLYSAYKLNCMSVAKNLLEHNANPNLGGTYGSFPASLVSAWPHKKELINKQWADMLFAYPIDVNWTSPFANYSAKELVDKNMITIDYPEIWESLTNLNKRKQEI